MSERGMFSLWRVITFHCHRGEHQQYGREDERDEVVGNEDDAEGDDDERHEHHRSVDAETALYLVARVSRAARRRWRRAARRTR